MLAHLKSRNRLGWTWTQSWLSERSQSCSLVSNYALWSLILGYFGTITVWRCEKFGIGLLGRVSASPIPVSSYATRRSRSAKNWENIQVLKSGCEDQTLGLCSHNPHWALSIEQHSQVRGWKLFGHQKQKMQYFNKTKTWKNLKKLVGKNSLKCCNSVRCVLTKEVDKVFHKFPRLISVGRIGKMMKF